MEDPEEERQICPFCNVTFKNDCELRRHCDTDSHKKTLMSDEGRDWHWRPPPRGVTEENYKLCENWMKTQNCRYGIQCVEAHGLEEITEWRERFRYRCMKLQRAHEKNLYGVSYTEHILQKWTNSSNPDAILHDNLQDVKDTCSSSLSTTMTSKNSSHEWLFTLKSPRKLMAIALMQDTHRNHFALEGIKIDDDEQEITNKQEWKTQRGVKELNAEIKENGLAESKSNEEKENKIVECKVKVVFNTSIFGAFRQSVVFDFGSEPALIKHLSVDVVPVEDLQKINELCTEIIAPTSKRWRDSEINAFTSNIYHSRHSYANFEADWGRNLAKIYPFPVPDAFTISSTAFAEKSFTATNYKRRMHDLLFVEEIARHELVSRFDITVKLTVAESYILSPNGAVGSSAKYSCDGELFALMPLSRNLSDDTAEGRLILDSCHTVLVQRLPEHGPVHEALIEDRGKSTIYLRFSAQAVNDLRLVADDTVTVRAQFRQNRVPYCEWHYAVDKVRDCRLLFPDIYLIPKIPWSPEKQWSPTLDKRLNLKQKQAILAITTPLTIYIPPVLIIGPFGTGKTFTLAHAVMELMLEEGNRVLICTHSNSAADLYIKDYFHPFVESGHKEARPLRIYYHKRWVSTVHPIVQQYCLIETTGATKSFALPTLQDITGHRIIVTTLSISLLLSEMRLPQNHFTHILIDEAAQALECETTMPLTLANINTRIVLAGDHMQLSPDLFSPFVKDRKLHVSLLERLYDFYPKTDFPCRILLRENYRAHEAIIDFTSESFYEQKLVAKGKQPRHERFFPLTFFTAKGEDVQDLNSTSYYNHSEVYEIVERVAEISSDWPESWGETSIGIVTPYADQVFRIRSELRKRRLGNVSVERVLNVQGKQFRAVFLSTVRTRKTCKNDGNDYGFLSNGRLLNTAITRAQSLVAVVGDPLALCSVGKCAKIWERFVQTCDENGSFFGSTFAHLKLQLDGLELKKEYVLNPLAPVFVPRQNFASLNLLRNGQVNSWFHPLNDFLRLLPREMCLRDVLLQPSAFHERWYHYLLQTRGINEAKMFQYLMYVTTTSFSNRLV